MGGASRKNFDIFRKLCGDDTLKNVTIVTTMWGEVDSAKGTAREERLKTDEKFFKPAIDNDALLVRHDGTSDTARTIIRDVVQRNSAKPLCVQRELVTEGKKITETSAGKELYESLVEQIKDKDKLLKEAEQNLGICLKELEDERRKAQVQAEMAERVYAEELARLADELERVKKPRGRFRYFTKNSPLGYLARAVRGIFTEVIAPIIVQEVLQANNG